MVDKKVIDTCADVVKELAKDVYVDGLQPATKQIGKALETVVGLANTILLPVKIANYTLSYKASEFILELENKIKNIPTEKLIEPPLRISGPVLEGLKYTDTPEIRNMFLNLLSSAMNSDTETNVHPSFVEIIKQLSPLDAKIFNEFAESYHFACAEIQLIIGNTHNMLTQAFPTFFVEDLHLIADPFLVSSSIQNLIRLGLINWTDQSLFGYDYDKLSTTPYIKEKAQNYSNTEGKAMKLRIVGSLLVLNDYGTNFKNVCL